jgi:hypothetical protein
LLISEALRATSESVCLFVKEVRLKVLGKEVRAIAVE